MTILRRILTSFAAAAGIALAAPAWSQPSGSWPARPVRVIVPFTPGGTADTLGRLVAQKLSDAFKQSFVVENRAGAGGVIACELVAKAAPDGYTLVISGVATHAVAPALTKNFAYDPVKDFSHIALFGGPPSVFVVNPQVPAKTLAEFIALAKTRPDQFSYGSPGNGSQGHLIAELLKHYSGIKITHVPYKGASAAVADLIAGHIPTTSTTLSTASTQIRAGRARALAVSSSNRLPDWPDVPTFRESGYPELVATIWFSLSGPAGMPAEVVTRLNHEVRRALQLPDVHERLKPEGIEPGDLDPQAFTAFLAAEVKRWAPIVRESGARRD